MAVRSLVRPSHLLPLLQELPDHGLGRRCPRVAAPIHADAQLFEAILGAVVDAMLDELPGADPVANRGGTYAAQFGGFLLGVVLTLRGSGCASARRLHVGQDGADFELKE